MINSLFSIGAQPKEDDSLVSKFTLIPPGNGRRFFLGSDEEADGDSWCQAINQQVASLEKKVVSHHSNTTMEGYLHLMDSKTFSWSRYYFILNGRSFQYHNSISAELGAPMANIILVSGKSTVKQLPFDDFERAHCFNVTGEDSSSGRIITFTVSAGTQEEVDEWASAILIAY
uniref:PH domain-containing protein n=1 Tax=Amorphochlora amoebiformis TaxID=1561963 RepID=A0A7S0GZ70_9EUKA|mmetsp:Transcript_28775/g.45965  ORF Transcript_28775/g.45965 Transcript_28775/m.45965 type:complete len:173 (+) Transcript_28775:1-519(+)